MNRVKMKITRDTRRLRSKEMTIPYNWKKVSDQLFVDRHSRREARKSYFERVCSICQKVQPAGNGINEPCSCGNDVVMVMPIEEAK